MIVNIFTLKYKYIVIIERRRKKTRGLIIFIEIFYSFYKKDFTLKILLLCILM